MKSPQAALAPLIAAHQRAQRTVIGHAAFVAAGCVLALVLRHVFRLPPLLGWTVFAAAFAVFARDIWRWLYCRHQLHRALLSLSS